MAERRTGPVKPPILDLTARPPDTRTPPTAAPAQPEAAKAHTEAGKADTTTQTRPGPPPAATATPRPSESAIVRAKGTPLLAVGIVGAVLGGVLGLGGAYGLATLGFWPERSGGSTALAALSEDMTALYVKNSDIGAVVDRALDELKSGLAGIETRLAALEAATPPVSTSDVVALAARTEKLEAGLTGLGEKLDAVPLSAAGPSDAAAIKRLDTGLAGLATRIGDIETRLAGLEARPATAPAGVAELRAGLDALRAEVEGIATGLSSLAAAPPSPRIDLRLPLALSGLADALASGTAFATELDLIRAALPDLAIPESIAVAATTGFGSPALLSARFEALVPEILAARPSDPQAGWGEALIDRLKSLVAMRPVGTGEDASPEALVGRIEAALASRDYAAASADFARLPEPMRTAAAGIDAEAARFAEASDLLAQARAAALQTTGASP